MKIPWSRREQRLADEYADALDAGSVTSPDLAPLVGVAAQMRPRQPINEVRRAQTRDAMVRAFERAQSARPASELAGSRDRALDAPTSDVYAAEVMLPEGCVYVADVEPISDARASDAAHAAARVLDALAIGDER